MSEKPWEDATALARSMAHTVMRSSRCRWIDIAIAEGWSRSLEDMIRSCVRETARTGKVPPLAWFDGFPVKDSDAKYFKAYGQAHTGVDLERIKAARALLPKAASVAQRITGENAA